MKSRLLALVTLCAAILLLGAAGHAAPKSRAAQPKARYRTKLPEHRLALHALQRLTFGPRPGDVGHLQKIGLKKWIDRQLHPDGIPENPQLATRLASLSSLEMSQRELIENFPAPQMVVAVATGRMPPPSDPDKRALLERLARRYRQRIEPKAPASDLLLPADPSTLRQLLTPEQVSTMQTGPPKEKIEVLQALPPERLDAVLALLSPDRIGQLARVAPADLRRRLLIGVAPARILAQDLSEAKLLRAIYSECQLQEVLVDFWFDHFNVFLDKGADRYLVTAYEREAIRPHVLGRFRDLLGATAQSPAMLFYLDNWQSVAPGTRAVRRQTRPRGLNENYARELLELHTLGVEGGYTQKDILEVARCFTGWTITAPYRDAAFHFNPRVHDREEKSVLGVRIRSGGGSEDGERVLDLLARHPSTARFISRKLAQRFVADDPPAALVDRMAKTFLKKNGDLREVLKTLFDSREFWSEAAWHAKIKSPFELVASAARTTGADIDSAHALVARTAELGQPLYRKSEPTGYGSLSQTWVTSAGLLARMNFALSLISNRLPGVSVNPERFAGEPNLVARSLLNFDPSWQTGDAIASGLAAGKSPADLAGLVLGSPDFQRR